MFAYRITGKLFLPAALAALLNVSVAANVTESAFIGAFDVGPQGNAQKFNPLTAPAGFSFYNKYFSTLTLYDAGFQKISGDLAESWSFAKDGKSFTIKLRKDVKWHDGQPFTANDVKFTLGLIKDPDMASLFAVRLGDVVSIKATDEHTVVLELANMDASIPDALTSIMMLPQHLLAKYTTKELRTSDWWRNPVGTGPYKWTKYLPDQYVELSANPDYFRGKPKIAKLVNRYYKDSSAAAIALAAGEIQYTYLTLDQVKENQSSHAFNVISGPSQVLNYIGINNNDPRFKDVRIRQAILMAIDRGAIIKNLYGGNAQPGQCALTLPKFVPADINKYEASPAKAKALLDEAGWARLNKGEPLEILTYYNDQVSKDVIATMQSMLAQVGINLKPRFVDAPTFGQLVDAGKFSLVFAGAGNGPDPSTLMPLLHSAYAPPKGVNRMRVNLPELDKLFDAGQSEVNEAKRTDIYKQMCRVTNAQLPWIPLWVANRYGGFSKRAQNVIWTPAPGGGRYQDSPENWMLK
jgi:peptide/nickel transport system substrate-binding protein